jgi:hypothetical protein
MTSGADEERSGVDLDRVWLGVATQVWRREPRWAERLAARLLRSPGLARALLTTPSLLMPWLIATVVVVGVGAAVAAETGQPLVGLVAPAVAGAGVAYSYGPGVDPAWELSQSAAVSARIVLLARALSVFGFNAALGLAASAVSGGAAAVTFKWLVPMTAVSALALAAATLARSANAGVAVGATGWGIAVLSGRSSSGRFAVVVTDSALVLPYLAFAVCCVVVVFVVTRIPRGTS